jgi:hypothetical protein
MLIYSTFRVPQMMENYKLATPKKIAHKITPGVADGAIHDPD